MDIFDQSELKKLYKPAPKSSGEDNGLVTVIGGSKLFHGAPLLSLKVASRIVDMVFFSSVDKSVGNVAEKLKSNLLSFIWIPVEEVESYINKSDACLIGPGFMRFKSEKTPLSERYSGYDGEAEKSRKVTEKLLKEYPEKKWVIDAGSLQVMDEDWIPRNAILTPNFKEFELLFKTKISELNLGTEELSLIVQEKARKNNCVIVLKGAETIVASGEDCVAVRGGNPGLTKGGSGDVLAGLTVALLAKNDTFLAATTAGFVIKKAADELYNRVGVNYNADDLSDQIPETLHNLMK